MIDNAKQNNSFPNVEYMVSAAERMPMLEDKSVVLVTAGRAIQYFDFGPFFSECKRVLKPNGIVAFYSSDHTEFIIPDSPDKAQRLNERFRKVSTQKSLSFVSKLFLQMIFKAERRRHERILGWPNWGQTEEIRRH